MTWLEPMWLAYPTAGLLLLVALFAWSVQWWLKTFPVAELNYSYEPKYERPRAHEPTNYWQTLPMMAMTATSAVAYIHQPPVLYDPYTGKRLR
jgi:hypothetical protein